jgi:hypothetical protein
MPSAAVISITQRARRERRWVARTRTDRLADRVRNTGSGAAGHPRRDQQFVRTASIDRLTRDGTAPR